VVDAKGQTLGRLASNGGAGVARQTSSAVHAAGVNTGDHVIVINSADLVVTGNKGEGKSTTATRGIPAVAAVRSYNAAKERNATFPFRHAVEGMLQHNDTGGGDGQAAARLCRFRAWPYGAEPDSDRVR